MFEIQLIYEGNGRYRAASKLDWQLSNEHFGQGEVIEVRPGKRRSRRQHGWFFHMIASAYDNQSAGPEFVDSEHLRAWLLIKVGHCDVAEFDPGSISRPMAAWLRKTFRAIDFTERRGKIFAKTPRSISIYGPNAIGSAEMTDIANKVAEVIMSDIVPGTTWDDWLPYIDEGKRLAAEARKRAAKQEAT